MFTPSSMSFDWVTDSIFMYRLDINEFAIKLNIKLMRNVTAFQLFFTILYVLRSIETNTKPEIFAMK